MIMKKLQYMKKYLFLSQVLFAAMFFCGCSGFSQLPEIDFTGMTKPEVIAVFAKAPLAFGTEIHLSVPTGTNDFHARNNLYFKTIEDALADERVKEAGSLGGYFLDRPFSCPGGTDYYIVVFGADGRVEKQEICSYFDGL